MKLQYDETENNLSRRKMSNQEKYLQNMRPRISIFCTSLRKRKIPQEKNEEKTHTTIKVTQMTDQHMTKCSMSLEAK